MSAEHRYLARYGITFEIELDESNHKLTAVEKEWLRHKADQIYFNAMWSTATGRRFAPMSMRTAELEAEQLLKQLRARKREPVR